MLYILGGLEVGYESLVTNVTKKERMKEWMISLDNIFTKMRTHDKHMEHMNLSDSQFVQANYSVSKQNFQKF